MLDALALPAWHDLGLFVVATFVLNATPGVDLLLTITRTLQGGARAGVAAALGINAGCVVHTLLAGFGLAALLAVSAAAFNIVKWAGAAYLLWLAVGMWRAALRPPADDASAPGVTQAPQRSPWVDFRVGLYTNVLNPKVAIFFLAFLPQFIPPATADKTLAFLALGAWFTAQSLLFLLSVVWLAARARAFGRSPRLVRGLQALGGALFLGLALRMAASERPAM